MHEAKVVKETLCQRRSSDPDIATKTRSSGIDSNEGTPRQRRRFCQRRWSDYALGPIDTEDDKASKSIERKDKSPTYESSPLSHRQMFEKSLDYPNPHATEELRGRPPRPPRNKPIKSRFLKQHIDRI
jgi:hypothetical protein